jgi:hypothetical protein
LGRLRILDVIRVIWYTIFSFFFGFDQEGFKKITPLMIPAGIVAKVEIK